jgi:hypothetical protein
MQHAFNLHGGYGRAFNRRQQHAPEGVANGGAESTLKGLGVKTAVFVGKCLGIGGKTLGLLETSPENHILFVLSTPLRLAHAAGRPQGGSGAGNCEAASDLQLLAEIKL